MSSNVLLFEAPIDKRCTTLSVADNNVTEESRVYQLILEVVVSNALVLLDQKIIPLIVVDNDHQGKHTIMS